MRGKATRPVLVAAAMLAVLISSMLRRTHIVAYRYMPGKHFLDEGRNSIEAETLNGTSTPTKTVPKYPQEQLVREGRPVTKLKSNEGCTPDPHQTVNKVPGVFENYMYIDRNVSSDKTPVVCKFRTDQAHLKHFAHAMQQLYGCYSFYQQHSGRTPKILTLPQKLKSHFDSNFFLKGFLQLMHEQMEVVILSPISFQEQYQDYVLADITYIPGGYIISHVKELNQMVQKYLSISSDSPSQTNNPRIGILNRRPSVGRSIQNTETIVNAVVAHNVSHHRHISVDYFEGKSFADQVRFFQNIDILVSPHGAQLTGLPFLSECGQLLEIFPNNYLIPAFYGSLARNSNLGYSYLYLSDQAKPDESLSGLEHRVQARAANLCLSPSIIQEAIYNMIQDWRECLRHRSVGQ